MQTPTPARQYSMPRRTATATVIVVTLSLLGCAQPPSIKNIAAQERASVGADAITQFKRDVETARTAKRVSNPSTPLMSRYAADIAGFTAELRRKTEQGMLSANAEAVYATLASDRQAARELRVSLVVLLGLSTGLNPAAAKSPSAGSYLMPDPRLTPLIEGLDDVDTRLDRLQSRASFQANSRAVARDIDRRHAQEQVAQKQREALAAARPAGSSVVSPDIAACMSLPDTGGQAGLTDRAGCVAMLSYWTEQAQGAQRSASTQSSAATGLLTGLLGQKMMEGSLVELALKPRWEQVQTRRIVSIQCKQSPIKPNYAACRIRAERDRFLTDGEKFKMPLPEDAVHEDIAILMKTGSYWYPDKAYMTAAEAQWLKEKMADGGNFSPEDCSSLEFNVQSLQRELDCKRKNEASRAEYADRLEASKQSYRREERRPTYRAGLAELKIPL